MQITKKITAILMILLMCATAFPLSSWAAEPVCTDENCMHEHDEISTETNVYSGIIGDSSVAWELDPTSGRLFITGSGGCDTFTSPESQPWAAVRTEIKEVWFNSMETLTIENLAYWFDGCTALETAEVPYTTPVIGTRAFANCPSLYRLMLYYSTTDYTIEQGAFAANTLTALEIDYIAALDETAVNLQSYDWSADNRTVFFADVYGTMTLASGKCSFCNTTCRYTLAYEYWSAAEHGVRHWCSNCGLDQCGGVLGEDHTFSNGVCTKCGYDNGTGTGGGGGGTTCYHTSTYKSWSGCEWTEYCSDCGEYIDSGTSHGSSYTSWSGCNWTEYCNNCGNYIDSGTSHSSYSYGSWEYDSSYQHRRYYSCSSCGEGYYEYGYHSTSTQYSRYSSTQHSYGSYCSTCGSYIGSVTYANHSFSYGSWSVSDSSQHRRLKSCSTCGYSEYEYANHSPAYTAWTNYSASQHRRTVSCPTCGYSNYEYTSHSLTNGAWSSVSDSQHQRTRSCSCGYSANEIGDHADTDENGYCDACEYLMTRFSVTVPASMAMTVSKHGEVYTAENAAIVNNSTGAVNVSTVSFTAQNGWTLVPYSANMANAKVDQRSGYLHGNRHAAVLHARYV